MKITKDVDYAIRTILYLSLQDNYSATKNQIAEAMKIPPQFLAKIAQQLYKARIIEITKGSKGRYRLIKKHDDITLLTVIEAIKGEIYLNYCIEESGKCFRKNNCYINSIWCELTNLMREKLASVTFKEITEKEVCYFNNN